MQNQEIVKMIENLKGRKNYEEKKASKLGFASLYEYIEDKFQKNQTATQNCLKEAEIEKSYSEKEQAQNKKCGCC